MHIKIEKFCILNCIFAFCILIFAFTSVPARAQEESTPSVRDLVREKVKEKLNTLIHKPQAVIGVVSQVTDHTIEIKTEKDSKTLSLVSTNEETKYFQITKGKRKEVKPEDIAIGQNILALGYKNEKDVLEAKRIITSDVPALENKKQVAHGNVIVVGKTTFTLKSKKNEERTVKVSQTTKITGKEDDGSVSTIVLPDIKLEDKAIAIGEPDESGMLIATRVHVIPGPKKEVTPIVKPTAVPTKKPTPTISPAL